MLAASEREIFDPEASGEFFIPVYNPTPACLLDYLPRQALVVMDNLQAVQDQVLEIEEQAVNLPPRFGCRRHLASRIPDPVCHLV